MPLRFFTCPDKRQVYCDSCIESCRMAQRCVSLSTLKAIYKSEREWDGVPHVTDLLNGPMYLYLKITENYSTAPESRAFALLGSTHHKLLEEAADGMAEVKVEAGGVVGTCDGVESLGNASDSGYGIVDFKTWGSFKVAKALGLEEIGKKPDPSGATYSRGGKYGAAGSAKMVPVFRANPARADLVNEIIQLNFYRIGLEAVGLDIRSLTIQATVRDGGTYTAKGYGVDRLIYLINVPVVQDEMIMGYLENKKSEIEVALDLGTEPRLCDDNENWNGRRCKDYCDVREFCRLGRSM